MNDAIPFLVSKFIIIDTKFADTILHQKIRQLKRSPEKNLQGMKDVEPKIVSRIPYISI